MAAAPVNATITEETARPVPTSQAEERSPRMCLTLPKLLWHRRLPALFSEVLRAFPLSPGANQYGFHRGHRGFPLPYWPGRDRCSDRARDLLPLVLGHHHLQRRRAAPG